MHTISFWFTIRFESRVSKGFIYLPQLNLMSIHNFAVIFLEIRKAFDIVNHTFLIQTLYIIRNREISFHWFE